MLFSFGGSFCIGGVKAIGGGFMRRTPELVGVRAITFIVGLIAAHSSAHLATGNGLRYYTL